MSKRKNNDDETTKEGSKQKRIECLEEEIIIIDDSENLDQDQDNALLNAEETDKILKSFDFEKIYTESIKHLQVTTKIPTEKIRNNYSQYKKLRNFETDRYVIANFGIPKTRKSSTFNYFMTGTIQNPLPNSSINGKGETMKPIRCEYTQEREIQVSVLKTNDLKYTNGASFQEFDTAFNESIKQKMEDADVEEIKIGLPERKYPEQAKRFKNFVFLDLIGMLSKYKAEEKKDEEKHYIEMNRRAVLRENIDGVFVFPEGRNMIDPIIFRQMCKCGLWSNCDSARPPKLTIVAKMRKGDIIGIKDLQQSLDGFCQFEGSPKNFRLIAKNIEDGICQAFDYGSGTDSNVDVLPLQNKAKHVPEMLKRVATLCVLEKSLKTSETDFEIFYDEQEKISLDHLEKILDDIRHYKNDSNLVDMLGYVQSIANELQIKLKSNAVMKKFKPFHKNIESSGYSRDLRGNNNDISKTVEDFVSEYNSPNFDEDEENLNMDAYDYAELRQQVKRRNLMYLQDHFLEKITSIHETFIHYHIKKSRIMNDSNNSNLIDMEKLEDRVTLQELKVEFGRLILPIRSQDTPFIDQNLKKKIFELVKLNDPYSIFGKVIKDDSLSSLEKTKDARILIDKLKQLYDKIKARLKIENR